MLTIAGGILLALFFIVAGVLVILNWRLLFVFAAVAFLLLAIAAPLVR